MIPTSSADSSSNLTAKSRTLRKRILKSFQLPFKGKGQNFLSFLSLSLSILLCDGKDSTHFCFVSLRTVHRESYQNSFFSFVIIVKHDTCLKASH